MAAIPDPALVWLVGPAGSGESTWVEAHFAAHEIVSSDRLRAMAGSAVDLVGRFRNLADSGVTAVCLAPVDLDEAGSIERLAPVVDAFSG